MNTFDCNLMMSVFRIKMSDSFVFAIMEAVCGSKPSFNQKKRSPVLRA